MSDPAIRPQWQRTEPALAVGRHAGSHRASFDALHDIDVDAAPDRGGDPADTAPEQALASAWSSRHTATFRARAPKAGWPAAGHSDHALAFLGRTPGARMAVVRIDLRPVVVSNPGVAVHAGGQRRDQHPPRADS